MKGSEGKILAKKKSILFKIWKFPQISETFIVEQIITAIKCGFEVQVLVQELQDIEESKQKGILEEYKIIDKVIIEDYKIPKKKIFRILKVLFLIGRNLPSIKHLIQIFKGEKKSNISEIFKFHFYKQLPIYEIIHVQYGTNVKPLDTYKKHGIISSKLIVSFHGHDAFFPINNLIPQEGYYSNLFAYGDLIIANTPYLAKAIEGLGCPKNRIRTIPVGVNTSFFANENINKEVRKDFKIITVGRLDKVKGHKYAIEIIAHLKKKGYYIKFSIVGEGNERNNLQNQIKENQLDEVVSLLGPKNQRELKSLLNQHDLYILTAVPVENQRRETQGLATLEAQACGLPAVVFDSGGVKYTVIDGETGYVVPEKDVQEMVLKIETIIKDSALRKRMGKKAVQFVRENYSQSKLRGEWCNIYENLAKNGR